MKAKWIDPEQQKPKVKVRLPPCSAKRTTTYWRDQHGDNMCAKSAIVNIDGKDYCHQHGSGIALRYLVAGTLPKT